MSVLEVNHLQKIYHSPYSATTVEALKDISFTVEPGEFAAVMGESGSGKTTLLNLLAMLDRPTRGTIVLDGKDTGTIRDREITAFRRNQLGFVFQDYSMLDIFNIKDNILLPLVLNGEKPKSMEKKLERVAEELGIKSILKKYPYEISGGQKQRAAIARALIVSPKLLLADEPTGALDSRNSMDILKVFDQLSDQGKTVVMVTHSIEAASFASRVLFIKDGRIFHQLSRGNKNKEQMYEEISDTLTLMSKRQFVDSEVM